MILHKPHSLGFGSRPIEFKGRFGLALSGYLYLPLLQSKKTNIYREQSLWKFLAKHAPGVQLDEGVPKLTSEFLLHGHAYPSTKERNGSATRVAIAGIEKTVLAFGARYWNGSEPTKPVAFEKLPLSWPLAYGGSDFPGNLQGIGRKSEGGLHWLPQLELPKDRLKSPRQAIQPAGFGALDLMHPQRVALRGTYDSDYLKLHSPGFPPDVDWKYFNCAPLDQWLPTALKGDEAFELEHLHPKHAKIKGNLPRLSVRMLANYELEGNQKLREVPMRLTTVWFFPDQERIALVYQGLAETSEHDGSDIAHLICGIETIGERKSVEHYLEVQARRDDPKYGAIESLNDDDLLPENVDAFDPEFERATEAFKKEGFQAKAQFHRAQIDVTLAREKAKEVGQNPDKLNIKMPVLPSALQGKALVTYLKDQDKEAQKQQWKALDEVASHALAALEFAKQNKLDPASLVERGPPKYKAEVHLQELRANAEAVGQTLDVAQLEPKLAQMEATGRVNYLQAAHMQAPAFALSGNAAKQSKREAEFLVKNGIKFLPGFNFTGADLSGLDLRGFNLAGAWLESANLNHTNLSGADLTGAVLAHANLEGVVAIGTKFLGANLGRAKLAGAVFQQSDFSQANFQYSNFDGADFSQAMLAGAKLLDTQWGKANWSEARAVGLLFYQRDLKGLNLSDADLSSANFVECDMQGLDLSGAVLRGTNFVSCNLGKANFQGAKAEGAIFAQTPGKPISLKAANFSGANLSNANLGACDLSQAKLVRTVLDGANLTDAIMEGIDGRLLSAKGALLRKAHLKQSKLAGANLRQALFPYADFRAADLRQSNLFGADLSRVLLDTQVRLEDALTERSRTYPRWSLEQQSLLGAKFDRARR